MSLFSSEPAVSPLWCARVKLHPPVRKRCMPIRLAPKVRKNPFKCSSTAARSRCSLECSQPRSSPRLCMRSPTKCCIVANAARLASYVMRTSCHVVVIAESLRGRNGISSKGSVSLRLWSNDGQAGSNPKVRVADHSPTTSSFAASGRARNPLPWMC